MPITVPAAPSTPSSAQTLSGQQVFDYYLDDTGAPIPNAEVTCTLQGNFFMSISPPALVQPKKLRTTTDQNGYWTFTLVPNTNLNPANSVYSISLPDRSYDITVGPSGPYQSTATGTLVSIPTTLAPATSSVVGPLSVAGLLSAQGGLSVAGGITLTSGTLSLAGASLTMAGPLTLTAAASQVIPGATSFSVRDTGNANDNLLISNAGLVTARAGLVATAGGLTVSAGGAAITGNSTVTGTLTVTGTINSQTLSAAANLTGTLTVASTLTVTAGGLIVTAGDLTITGGELIFADAVSQINPGATSFAITNNANSANNLLLTDAGLATFRNAVTIPPAAGGTAPTTGYGTVENVIDFQTPAAAATITIPASGVLPTGYRHLKIKWKLKTSTATGSENISQRFNGSAAANYWEEFLDILNGVVTGTETNSALTTGIVIGNVPGSTAPANSFASGEITIFDYNSATDHKTCIFSTIARRGTGASGADFLVGGGGWVIAPVAITTLTLVATGNLTGFVTTEGIP